MLMPQRKNLLNNTQYPGFQINQLFKNEKKKDFDFSESFEILDYLSFQNNRKKNNKLDHSQIKKKKEKKQHLFVILTLGFLCNNNTYV